MIIQYVSPGLVNTGFLETAGLPKGDLESPGLSSEDNADGIRYVIRTKPHVNIPELTLRHKNSEHR